MRLLNLFQLYILLRGLSLCPALQGISFPTCLRDALHLLCLPTWVMEVQGGETLGGPQAQLPPFLLLYVEGKCLGKSLLQRRNGQGGGKWGLPAKCPGTSWVLQRVWRGSKKAGGHPEGTGGNMKAWLSSSSWGLEGSQLDVSDVLQAWALSFPPALLPTCGPHSSPSLSAS